MNTDQEKEWVAIAQKDPQAFKCLYDHYFARLYSYVSYRVGRVQDTEDLVAETFLKAIEGIESFRWQHENSFAAWLFRIARNLISNFYRQKKRWESVPLDELPTLQTSSLLPDDVVLQKEKFQSLRRLISTLTPRQQEIITLRFFGGLRNQEIAEVLGIDERTVAAHLCRGLETAHRKYINEFVGTEERNSNER
ncbi:MAG: sigma-70 family RNA polymerase sigma factor [Anaerolineae bacterium]|nr:sigma-70 family RNA polymerase sigma factor [Anaerolineae bacterium]